MHAEERRETILKLLRQSAQPVSASTLAGQLSVSRQIIVGDIALLRAGGADILSHPPGVLPAKCRRSRSHPPGSCPP